MYPKVLLKIARDAIKEQLTAQKLIDKQYLTKEYPFLLKNGAVFVTLNKNRDLRGCIGSLVSHRTLIDDVIYNAKAAAFDDVRFLPLSQEEFDQIEIEVSVLSEPEKVSYSSIEELKSLIVPYKDGIILRHQNRQATFLPQVWEQLPEFDIFFAHLGQKAGLGADVLEHNPEIYKYRVDSYSE